MFEIITELLKDKEAHNTSPLRRMGAIQAGNYKLSIQGSEGHYCIPRKSLPINFYKSFELAIFNAKGNFLNIRKSSKMRKFGRYSELVKCSDGGMVHGYVDTDLINDLYLFLTNKN